MKKQETLRLLGRPVSDGRGERAKKEVFPECGNRKEEFPFGENQELSMEELESVSGGI